MDFLLRKKYSYTVPSSFDKTKMKFESILNNKWYDFSKKYYGTIDDSGGFTFKQKIVFFSVINFGQAVYLKGNLTQADNGININIVLSPNLLFVFIIYLMPLLWLNILLGDNSLMGQDNSRLNNFFIVLIFEFAIFAITQIISFFLRRKFESVMIEKDFSQWQNNYASVSNDNKKSS